jgi:hypothetical protein
VAVTALATLVALACSTKSADGASCGSPNDCKSGVCDASKHCGGSTCSCGKAQCTPPAASSDCDDGWLCTFRSADVLDDLTGGSSKNVCIPTCGSCPDGMHCGEGGVAGQTPCTSGDAPPTVSIVAPTTSVHTGDTVALHAEATSPSGAIVSYTWSFSDTSLERPTTADVTHVIQGVGLVRIGVTVKDTTGLEATGSLDLSACEVAGSSCYFDDNCCSHGCGGDGGAKTCL